MAVQGFAFLEITLDFDLSTPLKPNSFKATETVSNFVSVFNYYSNQVAVGSIIFPSLVINLFQICFFLGGGQGSICGIFSYISYAYKVGVPCSKPLGGSRVDSAFHPPEVDKMSTRNFWELSGKK